MDLTTVVMPGAQSLVAAIATDTWVHARTAIAELWARRHPSPGTGTGALTIAYPNPDPAAIEAAGKELETARQQALELAGNGSEADRAARMQLFWAGYLAGQLAARPELADVFAQLPALLGEGRSATQIRAVQNNITGTVRGSALQAGDIHGNITFGR
jgi:hypothetical protein